MTNRKKFAGAKNTGMAVLCAAVLLAALGAAADSVKVIKAKPELARKYFDPANKPREMPELHGAEQAVCQSKFSISPEFQVAMADERRGPPGVVSRVRVVSLIARLSLQTTEWLPNGAGEDTKVHEAAHSRIAQLHYKDAEEHARRLAQKYLGQTFTGEGDTPDAARRNAIAKAARELGAAYLAAVERPSARVNDLFDEITNHGRKNIAIEEAIRQAFERYAKEKQEKAETRSSRLTLERVAAIFRAQQDVVGREINPFVIPLRELRAKWLDGNHFIRRVVEGNKVFLPISSAPCRDMPKRHSIFRLIGSIRPAAQYGIITCRTTRDRV